MQLISNQWFAFVHVAETTREEQMYEASEGGKDDTCTPFETVTCVLFFSYFHAEQLLLMPPQEVLHNHTLECGLTLYLFEGYRGLSYFCVVPQSARWAISPRQMIRLNSNFCTPSC